MKKATWLLIVILLTTLFFGCTDYENIKQNLKKELVSLEQTNAHLNSRIRIKGQNNSITQQKLDSRIQELKREISSIEGRLSDVRKSREQIRAVSAIFETIENSYQRFEQRQKDIIDQHSRFQEKERSFRFVATTVARRTFLQEMKDINSNIVAQCNLQKDHYNEIITMNEGQIKAVSWTNSSYKEMANSKFNRMKANYSSKIDAVDNIHRQHNNYDFTTLERSLN